MAIRMTGMVSGMDTESMIRELMSAHSMKKTKIEQKKTKLEWKQEKWAELNTKIYKLYTDQISKLRLSGTYAVKKASSSNENLVTATASTTAGSGSHTIKVDKLASAQFVTGDDVLKGKKGSSKLVGDLGLDEGNAIRITNGKGDQATTKTLEITADTTINDLVTALKEAGLNANFDENFGRFFISGKESGKDNAFAIQMFQPDGSAVESLENAKQALIGEGATGEQISQYRSLIDDMLKKQEIYNKDQTDKEAKKAYDSAVSKVEALEAGIYASKAKTLVAGEHEAQIRADQDEMQKLTESAKEGIYKKDADGNYTSEATDEALKKIADSNNIITLEDLHNEAVDAAVKKAAADYTDTEDGKNAVEEKAAQLGTSGGLKDAVDAYKAEAVTYYEALRDPENNGSTLVTGGMKNLGLANIDIDGVADEAGPAVMKASDAEIILDGAALTGNSNSIVVSGVTYDIKDVTGGATVRVNVTNDVQGVFDMVKDFVAEYNELLEEMNSLYGAESSRGYEPLTDEEKESMSEKQIEKWEQKIKGSLLRRDDTLGRVMDTMRSSLLKTVTVNGKQYSLFNFGIGTGDYTEKGLLHIDGDKEDSAYADKTDKLTKLFTENPEDAAAALSKIMGNLYSGLQDKMKSTSLSSALTFYNDKEMKKQVTSYSKEISTWETRLQDMEDKYYKQFSAMETALAKLQSQSSYMSSLFGG